MLLYRQNFIAEKVIMLVYRCLLTIMFTCKAAKQPYNGIIHLKTRFLSSVPHTSELLFRLLKHVLFVLFTAGGMMLEGRRLLTCSLSGWLYQLLECLLLNSGGLSRDRAIRSNDVDCNCRTWIS